MSNPELTAGRIAQPKLCPLCQQPLSEVERWGVRLDVCQRCQGVWLDQGELEQIVGFVRASMTSGSPAYANAPAQGPYQGMITTTMTSTTSSTRASPRPVARTRR